jgi:hypothetical protein
VIGELLLAWAIALYFAFELKNYFPLVLAAIYSFATLLSGALADNNDKK